jgi:hypothetical protein
VVKPLPPQGDPLQKARQELESATQAFQTAVRAYQEAAASRNKGVSQEEISSRFLRVQEEQRRLQAAQQAFTKLFKQKFGAAKP